MSKFRSLAVAALAGTAVAALSGPAFAQHYARIGEVDISHRNEHAQQWARFAGPMEGLRLVATNNDVHCRSVRVQYGNGHWRRVFKGHLAENQPVDVDLNGGERRVRRIDFTCGNHGAAPARIYIEADIGRYAKDWRRNPAWAGFIDRMMGGPAHGSYRNGGYRQGHNGYDRNGWQRIGYETFDRRPDHQRDVLHGREGRHIRRIALRPSGDDARCSRIRVTFGNGNTRDLKVSPDDTMREGQLYSFDLPGHARHVQRIDLKCRGAGHHKTRIEILSD